MFIKKCLEQNVYTIYKADDWLILHVWLLNLHRFT